MKLILILLSLWSPLTFSSQDLLLEACQERGGEVTQGFQCPKTGLRLPWKFCLVKQEGKLQEFFDGCTGLSGGYGELFYQSCINHDLCYHHEPITSGLERIDCDKHFLAETSRSCLGREDEKNCERWAKSMYLALRGFGSLAFHCDNSLRP